jgi:hypothetical protein
MSMGNQDNGSQAPCHGQAEGMSGAVWTGSAGMHDKRI